METRLKNTLGLMLGLIGWAVAGHAQLDVEWTITIDYDNPPVQSEFTGRKTEIRAYWSKLSGSLLVSQERRNDTQSFRRYSHIDSTGRFVGNFEVVNFEAPSAWQPLIVGADWILVNKPRARWDDSLIEQLEYRVADGKGGYKATACPHEPKFLRDNWDLRDFYPVGMNAEIDDIYICAESSQSITIQKLKPRLRVTELQPNSAPQSSISRTDSGVTLSTDTQAGQSYRVQSSQDLKQWSDEEIIQGDGSTKSVQRPSDKPKEFLRVVEE